jgi:pimeloyl-ACP methyl ester carboxylesterase
MPASCDYRPLAIVLALCCAFETVTVAQTTSTAQNPPPLPPLGKLVDVGGYRVHLYCMGAGSPTVVIVGAGYSFDWGLVQPEVAGFTQVCSYDHSGIGWSDPGPKDSCPLRVGEVHAALKNGGIAGPYVLVGHSLGAVVARLYAGQYPNDAAGLVFVDHAIAMMVAAAPTPPPPTSPPVGTRIAMGMEDDPNFSKLPIRDRELHLWGIAQARDQAVLRNNVDILTDCIDQADAVIKDQSHPFGDKPLVDVIASDTPPLPPPVAEHWHIKYAELQTKLLSLSRNSKQLVAENSGHFIIIDRPDVVIDAISQVVQSIRKNSKL